MSDQREKLEVGQELACGKKLAVTVRGRQLLLCRTKEGYYALDDLCSHAAAKLSEGRLKGHRILCPMHGAAFDIRTGAPVSRPARKPVTTYPVEVCDDGVYVLLR